MISLVSPGQWAYLIALTVLFLWRGPHFAAWVLLANAVVTLAVLAAMDWGLTGHNTKTLFLMLIDFASGAILLSVSGLPRLLAVGYAITVPLYAANIMFSVSERTLFAVVIAIGIVQIVVAGIGHGDDDRGGLRRRSDVARPLALPRGNSRQGTVHPIAGKIAGKVVVESEGVRRGPR